MFDIHDLRVNNNFTAFDTICRRRKIDFFLMIDVVRLIQKSVKPGEKFFDERIILKSKQDKVFMENIIKSKGHLLLEFGEDSFSVKPETYLVLKEIYEVQEEENEKVKEFEKKYKNIYFWVK